MKGRLKVSQQPRRGMFLQLKGFVPKLNYNISLLAVIILIGLNSCQGNLNGNVCNQNIIHLVNTCEFRAQFVYRICLNKAAEDYYIFFTAVMFALLMTRCSHSALQR